jgi:hypothetical protein
MFQPRSIRWLFTFVAFALLTLSAHNLQAQTETWVPATTGFSTEIKIWTSNGNTYAKVRLTFPTGGWRVDWGQVTRTGNDFTADAKVERWTGATTQAITFKENTYNLGPLSSGTYTFTFKSYGVTMNSQQFDPSLVAERWEPVTLTGNKVGVRIWTVSGGPTFIKVEFYFPDSGYRVVDWGQVTRSGNEFTVDIKAERWTGETEARTIIADHDYELGTLSPGAYSLVVKMYGTTVRTQPFSIEASSAPAPKLLTEENSGRAVALDSVTWLRLFPLVTTHNFSPDNRTRIVLFLANADLSPGDSLSAVTAQAEDAQHVIHPLTVEYVGKVPGFDWLTQVIVRPPDGLRDGGDLSVSISVRGVLSNKALLNIKPSDANPQ